MESERRPAEPEKTDLEMLLRVKGPEFFQKHAANIFLGILLATAITYFFYQRYRAHQSQAIETNQNTAIAYSYASQLRELNTRPDLSETAVRQRQELAAGVFSAAERVLTSDAPASQKAPAQLARADALWSLATVPPAALATTQPSANFVAREPSAYLTDAEAAYIEILSKYPDEKEIVANALISLASIDESKMSFVEARKRYQMVIDDKSIRDIYHDIAKGRLKWLADLEKPFVLAPPTTAPSTPIAPLALTPAPTVEPASPTTLPATQPASTLP